VRVSWFSLKTMAVGFSRFGLKTGSYGSCGLASKPLGFPNLGLKTGSCDLEMKPKTDESMRQDASDSSTLTLPFSCIRS
jgi:hypothetical protein